MDRTEPRRSIREIDPDLLRGLTTPDEPTTRPHNACSTADLKGPLTFSLLSFLGHLVLLCLPWVEVQCDQKPVTRSGFFMATGQPLLATDRDGLVQGRPKHADRYLAFLFVPLAGAFLAAVALSLASRGEQSSAIGALLALCGFGLLLLRGYEVMDVKTNLEQMERELGAVLLTWRWLPAFWISFACDLIAGLAACGYLGQDPPARGGTGPPGR